MVFRTLTGGIVKREEYRSLLGQLPIKSPTVEDLARLCPHLTADEAVEAFGKTGYVAGPPLRVRRGFQIINLSQEWVEQIKGIPEGETERRVIRTKNYPARLNYAYAGRTPDSYARATARRGSFHPYTQMEKAMAFAEANWGEDLILDDWDDIVEIYIQDPSDLVNDRYHLNSPRTKAILYVALERGINQLHCDGTKPESELYDEAIAEMTLDFMVYHELMGGRGGFKSYNCAYCGSGLGLSGCSGCGHRFCDNQIRSGGNTPLSRKMVAFLQENGHRFAKDPQLAWDRERALWENPPHL